MKVTITDIENKLVQQEQGTFQIICNEILSKNGLITFDYTGAQQGTKKTIPGTPDSIFLDNQGKYIFVEYTTYEKSKLNNKIKQDVDKCLVEIKENNLDDKVSKIIYMHNRKQPKPSFIENIKSKCKNISFEIYGSDYICSEIKNKYFNLAETYLELHDDSIITKDILKNEIQNEEYNEKLKEINTLYERAIKITNNQLSIFYLADHEIKELEKIYSDLEKYDYLFNNKVTDESKNYYHNLLIILQRIDTNKYFELFIKIKDSGYLSNHDWNYYADNLLNENENNVDRALDILENLYFTKSYKESLNNLIRCYFIKEDYKKIISIVSPLEINDYDSTGQLASFFLFSKDMESSLSATKILSYNNKFKAMPLYYIASSQLLFRKGNNKYKEQFKKAIKIIKEDDYSIINIITETSILIKEADCVLNYLMKIKNPNNFVKYCILRIIQSKDEIEKLDIGKIEEYNKLIHKEDIDNELIFALINESKGKNIKAIDYYQKSYKKRDNIFSLQKYIILSINNNYKIDEAIIPNMAKIKDYRISLLISQYFVTNYNYDKALEYSYLSIYLLNNSSIDPYKQFWYILSLSKINYENKSFFTKDHVIILIKNNKEIIKYLIDDSDVFADNSNIADLTIIKSDNQITTNMIGHKVDDVFNIDNDEYKVKYVNHKYNYLLNYSFNRFKDCDGIEIIRGTADDPNGLLQISESIKKYSTNVDRKFNIYEEQKNIPISALLYGDYSFDNYAKLINTLLSNKHLLFSGESIEVSLKDGFVIDITTLIILTLIGKLKVLEKFDLSKIYIPKLLKERINSYINKLISCYGENESTLGYSEEYENPYNIALYEIPNSKKMDLWKNLINYVSKFTVLETEFEYDEVINKNVLKIIDKVQLDSIAIAMEREIPYICDDLFMRKLSNQYKVKHTNTIFLLNNKEDNIDIYIDNIIELADCNYTYSFYDLEYKHLMRYLIENFSKENLFKMERLMKELSNNDKLKNFYKNYFNFIKGNLEKIRYISIFNEVFENNLSLFMIQCIEKYFS